MDESQKQKEIQELKTKITNLEHELEAAKRALFEFTKSDSDSLVPAKAETNDDNVVEGIFNGENMVGTEGKNFPVPANYASKSKLVEGDRLKLTIGLDGSFLFKQIGPVERRHAIGILKFENNAYHVEVDADKYNVLYASVTYHKAKPNDKVSVVLPANGEVHWAVLESVIHELSDEDRAAAQKILEDKVAEDIKSAPANPAPVDSLLPTGAHTAPNYNDVPSDTGTSLDSALEIDDLEIKGSQNTPTPDAVNPAEVPVNTPVNQAQPEPKAINNPIAELEI